MPDLIITRLKTLFELGFRPFFLLGLMYAPVSLVVWLYGLYGRTNYFGIDSYWHAHEMVNGFVVAIISGFLLTAIQNWTGKPGIRGYKLIILVSIWCVGRLGFYWPGLSVTIRAGFDLAFLPLLVWMLIPFLIAKDQIRNLIFFILIFCLWLSNAAYHFHYIGILDGGLRESLYFSIHIIILMIAIIAGRVIPFFSSRVIADYQGKKHLRLEQGALVTAALFPFVLLWESPIVLITVTGLITGMIHLIRLLFWYDHRIWRLPILWVLYVGYLWIPLGYAFTSLASIGVIPSSIALHAFTAGAMGTMIVGMVSRVSLGHTGRRIVASPTTMASYLLITFSALLRVCGGYFFPNSYMNVVAISGIGWAASMMALIFVYTPILTSPRVQ